MMKGQEIRSAFLKFFEGKGHKVCVDKGLIPSDPSILFTVAGMVPFKDYFLGNKPLEFSRSCSSQRCLRTNDIEKIGKTGRHLTFFEMLGNFSFGDYFKKEAIEWAWEFLVQVLCIPKDRLYVSVFKEDDEAELIWKKFLKETRIVRLGEADNFWKMGETGPCGPCSEIIFDLGEEIGCRKPSCSPGCDCDRFLEVWNLVFTEFDRQVDGSLKPLSAKNIDTGMGLERLSAILQGKKTPFECDLIAPIIDCIPESRIPNSESRIIADHIRAIAHLIYDGIIPSNEERGYVLRSLVRRAERCGKKLGIEGPFLYKLVHPLSSLFPYLKDEEPHIANIIKQEEDRFYETMERGLLILEEKIKKSGSVFSGGDLFKLYDTYGFPVDFAIEIIKEKGKAIDLDGYHRMMDEQREKGRKGAIFFQKEGYNIKTEFIGYETIEASARVIKQDGSYVILDKTPFYPESGGQIGDSGFLVKDGLKIPVLDTKKMGEAIIHEIKNGIFNEGDIVFAMVNKEKREGIKRAHSATHLLQFALREVLGKNVRQQGSLVENDRLRFDFNYSQKPPSSQIQEIEKMVYQRIMADIEVSILKDIPIEKAKEMSALMFFEDEYEERVRVVKIGDISKETCGGTHIEKTGKIGLFKIIQEGGVSSGIRRIEALTGMRAYSLIIEDEERLKEAMELTTSSKNDLLSKIKQLISENRDKQKEIIRLENSILKERMDKIHIEEIKGIKVVFEIMEDVELLRALDMLLEKIKSGVVILGNKEKIICRVTKDLTEKINANSIIKEIAEMGGGKGGGKQDFATTGGYLLSKIDRAKVFEIFK
ncbi:MAG: alanine--tRNA ligase [bacterium]